MLPFYEPLAPTTAVSSAVITAQSADLTFEAGLDTTLDESLLGTADITFDARWEAWIADITFEAGKAEVIRVTQTALDAFLNSSAPELRLSQPTLEVGVIKDEPEIRLSQPVLLIATPSCVAAPSVNRRYVLFVG